MTRNERPAATNGDTSGTLALLRRADLRRRSVAFLTVFLPIASLYLLGGLEFLERHWMDLQFRLAQRKVQAGVVVVDIDSKSLRQLEAWPWPRTYHATVLEKLLDAGAVRVGFDVDVSSRSNSPEDDVVFEQALAASHGRVVLPVFHRWQHGFDVGSRLATMPPLPEFGRHVTLASINMRPGTDGLLRKYTNRLEAEGKTIPSFASALAGNAEPELESFYIDYGISPRSIPRLSYADVLSGEFDRAAVQGRVVIVGASAVEIGDHVAAPLTAALPVPLVQALAYASLTQNRALIRQPAVVTLVVLLLLVLLMGARYQAASWQRGLVMTVVLSCVTLFLLELLQSFTPMLIDATPWVLSFIGLYGFALVTRIGEQDRGLMAQGAWLRRTESVMRHVVENSFDSIVTVGESGLVETFNRSAQRMFGYTSQQAIGLPLTQLVEHVEGEKGLLADATGALIEAVGRSKDGQTFPVELVVTAIDAEDEPKLVAVLRDITERKAHQEELKHQATHDPLTDLPNRFLLQQRIQEALVEAGDSGRTVAVLLLDLDRFKEINDALGHHTGDILLRQVARRLEGPLGAEQTIARLGGDEFAVLLPVADLERAFEVSWQLIEALRSPFDVDGLSLQVDTSIGISLFPDHGSDAESLLQRADVAMYVAKRKRSSLSVYRPEQDFNNMRHLLLRGDLRRAIENGLLKLVYQPKVLAASDRVVGVEALVRWSHPEHGSIPPDEFIGLAEHSGLIRALTHWVLGTALSQCAEWRRSGIQLSIAVNLSARNLMEEDLPKTLERLLDRYRVPPAQLTLEITESVIMEDPERALRIVTRLRDLGVSIAIDDFGTGYSSLRYLMRLPAQELKIDRSFVMEMERDPGSATIVHSTIDLAHNLGLKVVAEGVENKGTWSVLKELGCDLGQGYYFSRPVPAEALLHSLKTVKGVRVQDLVEASVPEPVVS